MLPYIKELLCNCSLFHPTDFQFMESNEQGSFLSIPRLLKTLTSPFECCFVAR